MSSPWPPFPPHFAAGPLCSSPVGLLGGPEICRETFSSLGFCTYWTFALREWPCSLDTCWSLLEGHFLHAATSRHLVYQSTSVTFCLLFLQQHSSFPGMTCWKRYSSRNGWEFGNWTKEEHSSVGEAFNAEEWKDLMPTELGKQLVKATCEGDNEGK